MSDISIDQTVATRISKLLAIQHYWMSKELIDRLGEEEGKKAIAHALKNIADDRISGMRADAEKHGIEPKGKANYGKIKDFPTPDWHRDEKGCVTYCPMAETWATYGEDGLKIGQLYCDIDFDLYAGFGLDLTRPKTLSNGSECCNFSWKEKEEK